MASSSSFVISMPSAPYKTFSASPQKPTNSLAITQVPKEFFHPAVLNVLREHFDLYGEVNQWAPLSAFGRILVVFTEEEAAEHAKRSCDPIVISATHDRSAISFRGVSHLKAYRIAHRPEATLRVFRADPNPIIPHYAFASASSYIPADNYLRPPALEKNFLISPPGSPPVDWEPIKEEPPNATPLAGDLMVALHKLKIQEHDREGNQGPETLIHPEDGGSGVGVYVEDCDSGAATANMEIDDEDWVYGQTAPARSKWKPVTAMPPMHATLMI
ncbi:Calcipressin-domain-containing protein [Lentinula detonsa]|uniref:Calcipressin-domain-containing protein n=1 Tax=Lentinula detonsa TaxID=2804962 RepID=A0A9W8NTB7_9AGAR|nr:Calcipressin-domain-containing protein [Lentinula detonsa]